jgi:hypothetical protein
MCSSFQLEIFLLLNSFQSFSIRGLFISISILLIHLIPRIHHIKFLYVVNFCILLRNISVLLEHSSNHLYSAYKILVWSKFLKFHGSRECFFTFLLFVTFLQVLPQFPLPTHDVIVRYWPPPEYEVLILTLFWKIVLSGVLSLLKLAFGFCLQRNTVAYDEDQKREVENAIVIKDAISDLPPVTTCFCLIFLYLDNVSIVNC